MDKDIEIRNLRHMVRTLAKLDDDEPWYYRFDRYWDENNYQNEVKYDSRTRTWYQYLKGVFCPIEEDEIRTIVFDWGCITNEKLSNSKVSFLLKRCRAGVLFKDVWDADPNIDNCLDGLVYKNERELRPHTWEYPSLEQIQRHYHESDGIIPVKFNELLQIIPNSDERDWFIQYCVNVIHKNFSDELFVVFYGPKGGGKSTILQLFENLFGQANVSKTPLNKIGKRFGLKELYNKRINVNPDLPIVPMNDMTISLLKQLTGNDGNIEVELKGRDSFSYPVRCFLVFGINQLMNFTARSEKEIESIFRRALLINLPTTLKRDTQFKESLCNAEFLDELYSWMVWMRPLNIIDDAEIDTWVDIQKEKWLSNSNPVLEICKEYYEYSAGFSLPVHDVINKIREQLDDDGYLTSQQLQTNVSQALQTMKIYRDNGRGINAKYLDITQRIF